MQTNSENVIVVRFDSADPPAGALTTPDGGSTAFTGWLSLIGALDRLCQGMRKERGTP